MTDLDDLFDEEGDDAEGDPSPEARPTLRGKFLLASPSLADARFAGTVVLIVRHDEDGALGIVVNRPLGVSLDEACREDVEAARGVSSPVFVGGPCSGPLVAVHNLPELARAEAELVIGEAVEESGEAAPDGAAEALSEAVAPGVWFCARRETLEALMRHVREGDEDEDFDDDSRTTVKFFAGYAGWAAGQLEGELGEGAWQLIDAAAADVYAGGDARHPPPPPTTALPPGVAGLLAILSTAPTAIVGGSSGSPDAPAVMDPASSIAGGIRQWVRLTTRAGLLRHVPERLIPEDPTVN